MSAVNADASEISLFFVLILIPQQNKNTIEHTLLNCSVKTTESSLTILTELRYVFITVISLKCLNYLVK